MGSILFCQPIFFFSFFGVYVPASADISKAFSNFFCLVLEKSAFFHRDVGDCNSISLSYEGFFVLFFF